MARVSRRLNLSFRRQYGFVREVLEGYGWVSTAGLGVRRWVSVEL